MNALQLATVTFQQTYLRAALAAQGGRIMATARYLRMHRSTLYRLLVRLGIPWRREPGVPKGEAHVHRDV
jgi:transcriptional regulator of acetoin/glycerol metabolism